MKLQTLMLLMILFFLLSCNQQSTTPELEDNSDIPDGLIKISMDMSDAPSKVDKLKGKLYNNAGDEIHFDFDIDDQTATAYLENIPSGDWMLTVNALDEDDNIIYTGTTEVTVYPGAVTPVSLHLNPATGSLQITVTWGNGGIDDQFEENDRRSDAVPLYEYTYYKDLYVSSKDDDWYAMIISADGLTITCDFNHADGDINIDLVDKNGNILASSSNESDHEEIFYIAENLETYYIHVYLKSGDSNTYTIWWDDVWQSDLPSSR